LVGGSFGTQSTGSPQREVSGNDLKFAFSVSLPEGQTADEFGEFAQLSMSSFPIDRRCPQSSRILVDSSPRGTADVIDRVRGTTAAAREINRQRDGLHRQSWALSSKAAPREHPQ